MRNAMTTTRKQASEYSARVFVDDACLVKTPIQMTQFICPHLPAMAQGAGGMKLKLNKLGYTLKSLQPDFEGWGVFQGHTANQAVLLRSATADEIEFFLDGLPLWEIRLISPVSPDHTGTWIAQARQQLTNGKRSDPDWYDPSDAPVLVHLTGPAKPFDLCEAAFDGHNLWFRKSISNPEAACPAQMSQALGRKIPPNKLRLPGLTQMDRLAYSVAHLEGQGLMGLTLGTPSSRNDLPGLLGTGLLRKIQWFDLRGQLASSEILVKDLRVQPMGRILPSNPDA